MRSWISSPTAPLASLEPLAYYDIVILSYYDSNIFDQVWNASYITPFVAPDEHLFHKCLGGGKKKSLIQSPYWHEIHISLRASNMALYHHNWRYSTRLQFYKLPLLSANSELYICKPGKGLWTVYAFYLRMLYIVSRRVYSVLHVIPCYSYYYISIAGISVYSQIVFFSTTQSTKKKELKKTSQKALECYLPR